MPGSHSHFIRGGTVMCLPGLSSGERGLEVLLLLMSDMLNTCCMDIAQELTQHTHTLGNYQDSCSQISLRTTCNNVPPILSTQTHGNPKQIQQIIRTHQGNMSRGKKRTWGKTGVYQGYRTEGRNKMKGQQWKACWAFLGTEPCSVL